MSGNKCPRCHTLLMPKTPMSWGFPTEPGGVEHHHERCKDVQLVAMTARAEKAEGELDNFRLWYDGLNVLYHQVEADNATLRRQRDEARAACAAMTAYAVRGHVTIHEDAEILARIVIANPGQPLLDELARLWEIVQHLPRTADGVPMMPGMTVYDPLMETEHIVRARFRVVANGLMLSFKRLYSSRAAYEAERSGS